MNQDCRLVSFFSSGGEGGGEEAIFSGLRLRFMGRGRLNYLDNLRHFTHKFLMTNRCPSRNSVFLFAITLAVLACAAPLGAGAAARPIRALLITGGCCHDYAKQKDILKNGLEQRANIVVDQIHTDDKSTHPPLAILGNPDYAKGYDLVIHDECAADISDPEKVTAVLKPHLDGLPGVNLHCAMHSYRIGNPNDPVTLGTPHGLWFEYLGLQSSAHGPQTPISIHFVDQKNPITKGLSDWTTVNEEHYNNIHIFDSAHAIAHGVQVFKQGETEKTNDFVVVWFNTYGPKKTRVFSTTIGHNNTTVDDSRYLDLVTRGVLWATGHLKKDGSPVRGYAAAAK
jgi:hypothetical protein